MYPWQIKGFPEPDGVAYIQVDGVAYLVTANEGDIKEYEKSDFPFEWAEAQRGNAFSCKYQQELYAVKYVPSDLQFSFKTGLKKSLIFMWILWENKVAPSCSSQTIDVEHHCNLLMSKPVIRV